MSDEDKVWLDELGRQCTEAHRRGDHDKQDLLGTRKRNADLAMSQRVSQNRAASAISNAAVREVAGGDSALMNDTALCVTCAGAWDRMSAVKAMCAAEAKLAKAREVAAEEVIQKYQADENRGRAAVAELAGRLSVCGASCFVDDAEIRCNGQVLQQECTFQQHVWRPVNAPQNCERRKCVVLVWNLVAVCACRMPLT